MKIEYQEHTLENGLKVVLHEDHSVPKITVNILYRVGSRDESPDRTGFAHLFEHLMFEGSKHIPSYDTPLQRVGGQNNAFTYFDMTDYYLNVPSNQLETGLWLESDRMLELDFSQEKLDIQKSVVIEEYKQRYLNQPYGDAHHKLLGIHYTTHPYKWPVIGKDISHIEGATLQDVKDFFFGFYAPNNATLVIAGDLEPQKTLGLVEKWFGGIPRRELNKRVLPTEPEQSEARHLTVEGDVPFTAVYKMYHVPAQTERGYYIADIITDLLANGKSGRLVQDMVHKRKIASQANAFSWGLQDPGSVSVEVRLLAGQTPETYEHALTETLEDLQNLTESDLERIKNKLESTFVFQKTTIANKALGLAMSDSLGDIELINKTPGIYQSITLEEVKAAAQAYFTPSNCSTLYYLPTQHAN
ncbi:MAG: pitrilysin family protein [Bacteroidota bacterium]